MKKILFLLIILLLFPITVYAKTPNKEETFNAIKGIRNITVIEGITIESTRIDDNNIIFTISGRDDVYIKYKFVDKKLSFYGGYFLVDSNNKVIGVPFDNEYAFFLYSILENQSKIPYDADNYYNTTNIKQIINNKFSTHYVESTNTFGIDLEKVGDNKYQIIYNYYLDGEYPIVSFDSNVDGLENPATGNYSLLISIMLIAILCIGLYAYVNGKKKA